MVIVFPISQFRRIKASKLLAYQLRYPQIKISVLNFTEQTKQPYIQSEQVLMLIYNAYCSTKPEIAFLQIRFTGIFIKAYLKQQWVKHKKGGYWYIHNKENVCVAFRLFSLFRFKNALVKLI